MQLGPYRLRTQLGAGKDGVAYQAQDTRDESPAEVWTLEAARADAGRWAARSKRLRGAALLRHPAMDSGPRKPARTSGGKGSANGFTSRRQKSILGFPASVRRMVPGSNRP